MNFITLYSKLETTSSIGYDIVTGKLNPPDAVEVNVKEKTNYPRPKNFHRFQDIVNAFLTRSRWDLILEDNKKAVYINFKVEQENLILSLSEYKKQ